MTMTLEALLSELESEIDPNNPSIFINNPYQQSGTMEADFEEQLAATLGNDFPYFYAANDTASHEGGYDSKNVIDQYISTPLISDDILVSSDVQENKPSKDKEETKKKAKKAGGKRHRQPSQVQDHIMAERKRREILSHMFISLSAMIPDLKKIDKTTVLGAAIKHMKELQEKVKELESVIAKQTMESMAVVKRSRLEFDNESDKEDIVSSSTTVCRYESSNNNDGDNSRDIFPEIEIKISEKTLLLKVYCKEHNDVFTKLSAEVNKRDLSIINFSVVPFENSALDITIVAKMERGFNKNVTEFVTTLRNVLRFASFHRLESNESK